MGYGTEGKHILYKRSMKSENSLPDIRTKAGFSSPRSYVEDGTGFNQMAFLRIWSVVDCYYSCKGKDLLSYLLRRSEPYFLLSRKKKPTVIEVDQSPLACALSELKPIDLIKVRRTPLEKLYKSLIEQHHYLKLYPTRR